MTTNSAMKNAFNANLGVGNKEQLKGGGILAAAFTIAVLGWKGGKWTYNWFKNRPIKAKTETKTEEKAA